LPYHGFSGKSEIIGGGGGEGGQVKLGWLLKIWDCFLCNQEKKIISNWGLCNLSGINVNLRSPYPCRHVDISYWIVFHMHQTCLFNLRLSPWGFHILPGKSCH
jgi:hypothetical protein